VRLVDRAEYLYSVVGSMTMRLIREGEQAGAGVTLDELHVDVIAIAQQYAGFALSPAELTRLESYERELHDFMVGRGQIANPAHAGDLAHMAYRALAQLNERAPAGKHFVMLDALYLVNEPLTGEDGK